MPPVRIHRSYTRQCTDSKSYATQLHLPPLLVRKFPYAMNNFITYYFYCAVTITHHSERNLKHGYQLMKSTVLTHKNVLGVVSNIHQGTTVESVRSSTTLLYNAVSTSELILTYQTQNNCPAGLFGRKLS